MSRQADAGEQGDTPALDWLFSLQRFGMEPGLERTRELLSDLGLPAAGTNVVLVAGTNGKGTVTRLVAAALAQAGHVTGSFFSPHLERVGERVRMRGVESLEAEMEAAVAAVRGPASGLRATFFEVITAAALLRFAAEGAEWAVMEVGMGGRLDATNALEPDLSVVTGVGLDHQAVLGPDVAAIAREKAGVFRRGVPAVTGADGEALGVLTDRTAVLGTPLAALGVHFTVKAESSGWDGSLLTVDAGPQAHMGVPAPVVVPGLPLTLKTPLIGLHQVGNVAVAAAASLLLGVSPGDVQEAFATTRWPGRLERIDGRLTWLLDGAHNPQAAAALAASLAHLGARPAVLVVGVSGDKDVSGVLAPLAGLAHVVIATRATSSPRSVEPAALALAASDAGAADVRVAPTCAEALLLAQGLSQDGDIVLVAGSLFLVGEARSLLLGAPAEDRERWQ